ncbi:MAG: hypothetical protein K9N23_19215 [Akkermansiaceae bacterium]|nr:hypothetical protein [Akkermansiaceae bacterium]
MNTRPQASTSIDRRSRRGFALIVTMSLMVLLVLLAVGLLSLSTVTLRSTSQGGAQAQARANARLAMLLAMGELQRQAGADTRVSARADILDEDHPPVLGIWKSWEGTDHETRGTHAGRPVSPGNYEAKKKERFIAWLTSFNSVDRGTLPDTTNGTGKVTLVGAGSLGDGPGREKLQIHLAPTPVGTDRQAGSLAWWIGGENQKARLPRPYTPDNDTPAGWAALAKSHAVADPEPFRLETLLDDPAPADKAITLRQADLIASGDKKAASREFFHDLSAGSVGLLTNTATGGWRKDLSLLTESWDKQPTSRLPLFRLTPSTEFQATRPATRSAVPVGSMLYPWARYRGGDTIPIYQHGPVTSWANLVNYATFYKRVSTTSAGRFTASPYAISIGGDSFDFLHKVRILPVIARMQWIFSHSAGPAATGDTSLLAPKLLLTPAITMWNPYNVEISVPSMSFGIPRPLPVALRYSINDRANTAYNALMSGSTNNTPALGAGDLNYSINSLFTLKPGESRVFSPESATPVNSGASITLKPGYRDGGGHSFPIKDNRGGTVPGMPASTSIKADAKFDTVYTDRGRDGVGIYLDVSTLGAHALAYRMVYTPEVASVVYQPLRNLASATLGECQAHPVPFLSTIFGARTASRTHLAAKGFVQSSPFVNYTNMGFKDLADIGRHYGGTGHPVNSPFDYSFVKHAAGGDSQLPNSSDTTNRGYVVTGFTAADGLSRCVIGELPCQPLASLGELVNWDLRYENSVPPFGFNLIGNSDASPLLPPNAVVNKADASFAENLQHDDSYCANHLLFDDWFVSSITPAPTHFGESGRNQKANYTDFITGKTPLVNRAYRPIRQDQVSPDGDDAKVRALYNEQVAKTDSWKTIASRLEVEGMFNVNSTSVTAWRALLGHVRNQRVAYISESGRGWQAGLSDESDHVLSRFSIAGDSEAGTPGSSGTFPEATEFAGYRTVDGYFLDAMAKEVVKQVRARGPFLSLAEFVNRQLSSGDLALAGTIQAALNELAKSPTTNLFASLEALSTTAEAQPERADLAEYQFPAAAAGSSGYGLPGWTRQADILRPLAPILSARDDTFTIRGYGDARGTDGRILARAVCEAVVRRTREFVDPAEAADLTTPPALAANRNFGRRFEFVSFRWLTADEV